MAGNDATRYKFGLYEVNLQSGELFRNGQKLRVQEQPFQVLVAMLERPAEVVTREELRQRLWPSDTFVDFDHSLNTAINKLRDALGDGASNPRFIETLPRRGYRFIAPVQPVKEADDPVSPTPTAGTVRADGTASLPPQLAGTELPQIPHNIARTLFGLLQVMYLVFYGIALWKLEDIGLRATAGWNVNALTIEIVVLVSAVVGIALRLYTVNEAIFNYRHTGENFQRIFYFVLLLDVLWAMSPLLITRFIGVGLAFAACAALVYSPFAQRVLALVAWPGKLQTSDAGRHTSA
jgi:cholera toxin transcriptional activator